MVNHTVLEINGIKTWVSYLLNSQEEATNDIVVLVVPGNPGPIGFYDVFISRLHEIGGGVFSVYGVSHAGHHLLPPCTEEEFDALACVHGNDDSYAYSLDEQVAHKLSFIQEYLSVDSKIILIGHSVGAYIILEMIDRLDYADRLLKGVLLFPTIERITKTTKGWFWSTFSKFIKWPLLSMTYAFNLLPCVVQRKAVESVTRLRRFSATSNIPNSILSFLNCRGISNLLRVGQDMRHIQDLDGHDSLIRRHLKKLSFYYGSNDPWVPIEFANEFKERFPGGDIKICAKGIPHAFVLYNAVEVADMVWDWIRHVFHNCVVSSSSHVDPEQRKTKHGT